MADRDAAARLFHADWYLSVYPDVAGEDPFEHFCRTGAAEGRDPNPMFSTSWYSERYPDVAESGLNALEDFVSRGAALARDPGPLFSTRWYLARNPDVAAAGLNPLEHYLEWGPAQYRDPSPVFDSAWYCASYPDAAAPRVDARLHYMRQGAAAGYDPSPWFRTRWYVENYPEAAATGENPLVHYLTKGARQGYDPSVFFSSFGYRAEHTGCGESGENPLVHYLIDQQPGTSATAVSPTSPVSSAAIAQTKALIRAFSEIEPDLAVVPEALDTLLSFPTLPDRSMLAWRGLYLSLHEVPTHLFLVGCIDKEPDLAKAVAAQDGLLVLETDTNAVSTAEALPRGMQWRSLAEFAPDLDVDDRVRIVTALANGVQPAALTVWGSRAGWELLERCGAALRRDTVLFATATAAPDLPAPDLLRAYFRPCLPVLTALYGPDREELERLACRFGLPPAEGNKLRELRRMFAQDAPVPGQGLKP